MSVRQRKIIHIDLDCFYAAVEARDTPSLQQVPLAVGGDPRDRGVISTCNYFARQFGVRSAMPTSQALQLCPELVVVSGNMEKYREISHEIREIFFRYSDLVEPISLDEAFIDVTECSYYCGSATWIAQGIRREIFETQQLTASAGVAPNKLLAKIASDWHKPNGQKVITPDAIDAFMKQLAVTKLFGVGKVTAHKLQQSGFHTCSDLQKASLQQLHEQFGRFGVTLYDYCRGIDTRSVEPSRCRKSLSVENTFSQDLPDLESCLRELPFLLTSLERRLGGLRQRQICKSFVKIKFEDFQQTTVEQVSQGVNREDFIKLCTKGYERRRQPVRLLGVGVRFTDEEENRREQLPLLA